MPSIQAIRELQISPEQNYRKAEEQLRQRSQRLIPIYEPKCTHQAVIECIGNPQPECSLGEELVPLPKGIELRVTIQESCRDELIEDTNNKRRQNRENDVVKRQGPRFIGDLSGEVVEEGIL